MYILCFYSDGPESVTLGPDATSYFKINGSRLGPIKCNADCIPTCTFIWRYDAYVISTNNVLNIQNIQEEHAGMYACTATNTYGSEAADGILLVVLCKYKQ